VSKSFVYSPRIGLIIM